MVLTSRVEHLLSKKEILELYLNSTISVAARRHRDGGAQLFREVDRRAHAGAGGIAGGTDQRPSYFNPDRHPERAQERVAYVLARMQEDDMISADDGKRAQDPPPVLIAMSARGVTWASTSWINSRVRRRPLASRRAYRRFLHSALHDQSAIAARDRDGPAERARSL